MQANARSEANLYADTKNIGYVQDGDVTDENLDVIIGNWSEDRDPEFLPDTDGGFDEATMSRNAVQVFARRSQARGNPLSVIFGSVLPSLDVHTYAVATAFGGVAEEICLLALDQDDPKAIWHHGENTVTAESCGMCSNGGIYAEGTPQINVGDDGRVIYNEDGPGITDLGSEPKFSPQYPEPGPVCSDPIASLNLFEFHWDDGCRDLSLAPSPFQKEIVGINADGKNEINLVVNPVGEDEAICGTILKSGNDLIVDGQGQIDNSVEALVSIEFAPGLHHFKSSDAGGAAQDFALEGGADISVTGTDVTILLSNIQLAWAGASNITLTAPAFDSMGDGFLIQDDPATHAGFIFHQNPNSPGSGDPILVHDLAGDNDAVFGGMMYFGPYSEVIFRGTQQSGETTDCFAAIGGSFEFAGTVDIAFEPNDCGAPLPLGQSDLVVRLQD
jgi:hypothetical protein